MTEVIYNIPGMIEYVREEGTKDLHILKEIKKVIPGEMEPSSDITDL